MRLYCVVSAVTVALAISGCSSTDVITKKQMEMDARLEQLVQGNAAASARLAELTAVVDELQKQTKTNSAELAELKPAVKELKDALDAAPSKNAQPVATNVVPRIEVVNRDASPGDKDGGAQNVYMKAYGKFSSNDYLGAIEAFGAFIKNHPESEYAGNAQYWIGECYYTQRNYPLALDAFNKVLAKYPNGHKVPDAMLKIGFTLISMKEEGKARETLQALIEKYPKSQAAVKARERLNR
jgi:tol-pal system protein YbgF